MMLTVENPHPMSTRDWFTAGLAKGFNEGVAADRKVVVEWLKGPCPHTLTQLVDGHDAQRGQCSACIAELEASTLKGLES